MPGHRYWSINTSAVGGGAKVSLSIVQMLQSSGGANAIAGCGTGNQLSGSQAYRPFYGGGSWNNNGLPGWLGWYFGMNGAQNVTSFSITAVPSPPLFAPKDFTLEYSDDGSSWSTAATFTGQTWTNGQTQSFATGVGTSHLYWRINVSASSTGTTVKIQTIDLVNGGSLLKGTPSATTAGTSTGAAQEAAMFADIVTAQTGWCSTGNVPQRWVNDFGSGNSPQIVALSLTSPSNVLLANYNCTPTAFTLESSDDGSTWSVEGSFTATWASQNQTKTFGPISSGSMMIQMI